MAATGLLVVAGLNVGFGVASTATNGPAPARLIGTYVATLANYPALGFYKGR